MHRFLEHVGEEFRFLVEQYGFTETKTEPTRVRYSSSDVIIEVTYSDRAEVDVLIYENPPSHRFQFRLYLRLFYTAVEKGLGYGIPESEDAMARELKHLSNALKRYGEPLLTHDQDVFDRLRTVKWSEIPR